MTAERERIKVLGARDEGIAPGERDSAAGQCFFRAGGARPPQEEGRSFIGQHRERFGVEPICKLLWVAPSAYWRHAARQRDPALRSTQARQDEFLIPHIQRVWQANFQVYGAEKVWRQLQREGLQVARCTVERLMRRLGLRSVMRGKAVRTTLGDSATPCPLDRLNRQFEADRPNQPWVPDLTYVSTWAGFVYVAFVIHVFARRIVGWRVSRSMRTDFALDALEQALYARQSERDASLIHHSDRGSQYVSIRYTERLAEASIEPSVGSKGDSYNNALTETINGLYKAELIHRRAPWKTVESLELATLEWVTWFNHQRLREPLDASPAEAGDRYYQQLTAQAQHACIRSRSLYKNRGDSGRLVPRKAV